MVPILERAVQNTPPGEDQIRGLPQLCEKNGQITNKQDLRGWQ